MQQNSCGGFIGVGARKGRRLRLDGRWAGPAFYEGTSRMCTEAT